MTDFEQPRPGNSLNRHREFLKACDKERAWSNIQNKIRRRRFHRRMLKGVCAAVIAGSILCVSLIYNISDRSSSFVSENAPKNTVPTMKMSRHEADIRKTEDLCTVSVPVGAGFTEDMTDGSKIILNGGATLVYDSFKGEKREVELIGEAYFEVAHDKSKPFVVNTPSGSVEVLGTQFNIISDPDSTIVTLREGSVCLHFGDRKFMMCPGDQVCMKRDASYKVRQVNPQNYTSWSTGTYEFSDAPLEEIIRQLSLWYDVDIRTDSPELLENHFTGVLMRDQPLQYALDILVSISDIKVKTTENTIILYE